MRLHFPNLLADVGFQVVERVELSKTTCFYRGINLTGITLNPFSPMGGSFEAAEFLQAAKSAFIGYDVCDVVLEATSDEKIKETGEVV